MDMQIGFDFGSSKVNTQQVLPQGAWNFPDFTLPQYVKTLENARKILSCSDTPIRLLSIFTSGLAVHEDRASKVAASQRRSGLSQSDSETKVIDLQSAKIELAGDVIDELIRECIVNSNKVVNGIRYIAHNNSAELLGYSSFGMYLAGVGTIDITAWPGCKAHVIYSPFESDVMLTHYQDDMPVIVASYKLWHGIYSAEKISDSKKWQTNLPTFYADGREMIISAMSYKSGGYQGYAWTFVPESEWEGEVYDHTGIMSLFSAGKVQRGDLRGLAVLIKGKRCVVDGAVLVHDPDGKSVVIEDALGELEEIPETDDVFA